MKLKKEHLMKSLRIISLLGITFLYFKNGYGDESNFTVPKCASELTWDNVYYAEKGIPKQTFHGGAMSIWKTNGTLYVHIKDNQGKVHSCKVISDGKVITTTNSGSWSCNLSDSADANKKYLQISYIPTGSTSGENSSKRDKNASMQIFYDSVAINKGPYVIWTKGITEWHFDENGKTLTNHTSYNYRQPNLNAVENPNVIKHDFDKDGIISFKIPEIKEDSEDRQNCGLRKIKLTDSVDETVNSETQIITPKIEFKNGIPKVKDSKTNRKAQ